MVKIMIWRSDSHFCKSNMTAVAETGRETEATPTIPPRYHPHPSPFTAKPMMNGKLPSVRFSMGALKHPSMVQCFSESMQFALAKITVQFTF
jgi:hypothetical protein